MRNSFHDLLLLCPDPLQARIEALKSIPQRPDFHPEGNVFIHTQIVVNRLAKYNDLTLSWAAMFHDIGKDVTTKPDEKGVLQAIGHEDVSAKLVEQNGMFLIHQGVEPNDVYEIVKQHMRIHLFDQMRLSKQMNMRRMKTFGLLQLHALADDMLTLTPEEIEKYTKR
jgi:poly(A) polymerase